MFPENGGAVELFLRFCTQWRMAPMGGPVDLDYGAVDICCRRLALDPTPADWAGLMLMGPAAAAALSERKR